MSVKKTKKPELVAPAGNLEKMKTAFAFGADAVYAGVPRFSLRTRINDFDLKDLERAVEYAHGIGKKIYVTVNIFAHNEHLKKLPAHIRELKKIGPDGLIISDPGIMSVVKKIWPAAKLHLSTQANCVNKEAAKFWHRAGFKRIVLGRETTIDEVREIKKENPGLELETFVHGAMCMAYSGRCFLSKLLVGKSANLGDCVQPCRWKYDIKAQNSKLKAQNESNFLIVPEGRSEILELVEEEHGSYILNSRDLCLIKRIPELIEAGVSAFKIEGRAKSVYYLACVVGAYRRAIDETVGSKFKTQSSKLLNFLYNELDEKLYHRGYTEGFMFGEGKTAQNLDNSHKAPDWEFCGTVERDANPLINANSRIANTETQNLASQRRNKIFVKIHNTLRAGDRVEIITPKYDIIKMKVKKMVDAVGGEELNEAHGGQGRVVVIESDVEIPEFSVIRRKI